MLRERLCDHAGVEFLDFDYRRALSGGYEVFHVHWPETLLGGSTPLRTVARQGLLVLFLLRLTLLGIPIVRTAHNVELPQGLRRHEYLLLTWVERLTALRIRLNEHTAEVPGTPSVLIPHGHYRDWFAPYPHHPAENGRIGYAGLIRRYKGVETLIEAFATMPSPDLRLHVGGRPSSAQLAEVLSSLAAADDRVSLQLEFLSEAQFADLISRSSLVVLPYRFMHNSGGALATLSLNRPVLVPDNEVNRALAVEVGPGWVHLFEGDLDRSDLDAALTAAAAPRSAHPDLSNREWTRAADDHVAAYRTVVRASRRSGRSRRSAPRTQDSSSE